MSHMKYYQTFKTLKRGDKDPVNKNLIPVQNFLLKINFRKKKQLVSVWSIIGSREEGDYFGVFNIETFRAYLFLGDINGVDVAASDVRNAYLKVFTTEKYILRKYVILVNENNSSLFFYISIFLKDIHGWVVLVSLRQYQVGWINTYK